MKLRSVKINNFMGLGSAHLCLADKGLVLIQGENKDDPSSNSNGSGKSSLADAIFWCDFGSTAREKLGADLVVNRTAGKDCWVENEYEEVDGGFYTIKRWRKLSKAAKKNGCSLIYTDPTGVATDCTKGTDVLTQIEIDKALGRNEEISLAAVYAGQEKLPNLPAMGDVDLKKLIEEASGVTTLVKAFDIAKQRLKDTTADHDRWRLNHVRMTGEVQTIQTRLTELTARRDGFEASRAGQVAALKVSYNDGVKRAKAFQVERDKVDFTKITALVAALDTKIEAVHEQNEEEARLLDIERGIAGRRISMDATYRSVAGQARDQKTELDGVQGRIGTPCGTCGKPYEEHDLETATNLAKTKVRATVEKAREIALDVAELQRQEDAAKAVLTNYRASKTDVSATVEERKRLATALAGRATAEQAMLNEMTIAKRLKSDLDTKQAETNPYVDLADTTTRELNECVKEHGESEQVGAALEKLILVRKDVVKVYGPAGVRAHILDTVTPMLNDRTADYLGTLSDGMISAFWSTLVTDAKGELKEKFSITVEKINGGESFAALSGGEKRKVRLACALALQDLVASRATKPLALWCGDEIDDALDAAGLERLMTILENKARERGTVLVISHNALGDWIRDVTTVTMSGGVSSVSGPLCVT